MSRRKYVLKIEKDLNKLAERVDEVSFVSQAPEIADVAANLRQTLIDNPRAEALAAPQIGRNLRMFSLKFARNDVRTFINPMITKVKGSVWSRETNLSLGDQEYIMVRAEEIQAAYQTPTGIAEENIFKGRAAAIFQQMVELLDGVMISDYGLEVLDGFDDASEEEKTKILEMYMDKLKEEAKEANEEIEADPLLNKVKENMEFLKSVAMGETDLLHYEKDKDIIEGFKRDEL